MVCWWASWRSGQTGGDYYGVAVLAFPVLVAALAVSQTGMATVLARETMVMGGKISFALYLVHSIVFEVAGYLSGRIESMQAGSPLWIALQPQLVLFSLVLAYLLWRFVEEPARKWMRKVGPKSAPRPAAPGGAHVARAAGAVAVPSPRHQRSAGPARAAGHPGTSPGTSPGMTAVPGPATVRMLSQVGPDRQ
jgi:peptidoglycan/LPS O-acetylase OafA/YrhL